MKRKSVLVLGILCAVLITASFVGPKLILNAVRQPAVADSYNYSDSFYNSYDEIRAHITELCAELKAEGKEILSESYAVNESDGLYIDSFYLPSESEKDKLIVLTTGVHGMEGYIGSVMLDIV